MKDLLDLSRGLWRRHPRGVMLAGAVLFFFFGRTTRSNLLYQAGFLLALLGCLLRSWAAGQADSAGEWSGPYMLTSRPRRFGALLMLAGFAVVSASFYHPFRTILAWGAAWAVFRYYFMELPNASEIWPDPARWKDAATTDHWNVLRYFQSGEAKYTGLFFLTAFLLRFKMTYGF